jgi:hypothetical protein
MGKIIGEVALVAGAVALDVFAPAVGTFLTNETFAFVTAGMVQSAAMSIGMMGAGMVMSSIASAIQGGGVSTSQSVQNPSAPRVTIYGQTRVNGVKIYQSTINYTYNQVVAWASHPCQSVDYIYLDGREVYFTGNGHNAVAGASGFCDEASHTDPAGNSYNFYASSGNYHVYAQNALGSTSGNSLTLTTGTGSPSGDGLVYADSKWTSSCTLNGICATYVAATSNANMFSNFPQVKAAVKGKNNIYDPRLGALNSDGSVNSAYCQWTDNAALIIADFLTNSDYGFGFSWSEIDTTQLIAAANICDQPVALATGKLGTWTANNRYTIGQTIVDSNGRQQTVQGYYNNGTAQATSGSSAPTWQTSAGQITYDHQIMWAAGVVGSSLTEKQYTINGSFDWAAAPGDTLTELLEACAGRICIWNGQVKIFPGAWYGTTTSYTESDLVGTMSFQRTKSRDLCNAVRAKYICPSYPYSVVGYDKDHKDNNIFDGQYQPQDAPQYAQDALHGYSSDANLAADGGVRYYQDQSYRFVQSVGQAQRLMKIYLLRKRQMWSGTITVNSKGLLNAPNDVIQLTLPQYVFSNQLFEITGIRHVPKIEEGKPPVMTWELDLQSTDPSVYTWSAAEEMGINNAVSPVLSSALNVSPVTNVTLSSALSDAVVSADGLVTPRINVQWTEPNDPFVTSGGSIIVSVQPNNGTTTWTPFAVVSGTTTQCYVTGVVGGDPYNVQLIACHAGGASSTAVTAGPIIVGGSNSGIYGNEMLTNPGFESNYSGTATNTALTLGSTVSDGWTVSTLTGTWQPMLESASLSHSGTNDLLIRLPAGTVSASTCRVTSAPVTCTAGKTLSFGGYTKWGSAVSIPTGVTIDARIGLLFYNSSGTQISELYPGDLSNAPTSSYAWNQQQTVTVPTGATSVSMECCGIVVSGSGTSTGLCADLRFDDLYLISGSTSSTGLNGQGSITPSQPITYSTTSTKNSVGVSWTQQSVLRADGSTLTLQAGSFSFTGLASSTTYYLYLYINATTGVMGYVNGSIPPTSPSTVMATLASADGCIYIGSSIAITTLASTSGGTGGGSGGGGCPDVNEIVETEGKGEIRAGDVVAGDMVKGWSFQNNAVVYRRVLQASSQPCSAWRMIDGHRNSPCESVYYNGAWTPAFRVPGATLDTTASAKALITVEADEYGDHNYYIGDLLIHNQIIES